MLVQTSNTVRTVKVASLPGDLGSGSIPASAPPPAESPSGGDLASLLGLQKQPASSSASPASQPPAASAPMELPSSLLGLGGGSPVSTASAGAEAVPAAPPVDLSSVTVDQWMKLRPDKVSAAHSMSWHPDSNTDTQVQ